MVKRHVNLIKIWVVTIKKPSTLCYHLLLLLPQIFFFNIYCSLNPDLPHFHLDIQRRSGCEQSKHPTTHLKCQYTIENLLRSLMGSKILRGSGHSRTFRSFVTGLIQWPFHHKQVGVHWLKFSTLFKFLLLFHIHPQLIFSTLHSYLSEKTKSNFI